MPEFKVRLLNNEQIPNLVKLAQNADYPKWTEVDFSNEFALSQSEIYGAFQNERLVGFLIVRSILNELHIIDIIVSPDWRRQGVAKLLISTALTNAKNTNKRNVLLESRASNQAAIALYRQLDFKQTAIRKSYYSPNNEDAVLFELQLN